MADDTAQTIQELKDINDKLGALQQSIKNGADTSSIKSQVDTLAGVFHNVTDKVSLFTKKVKEIDLKQAKKDVDDYASSVQELADKFFDADEKTDHWLVRLALLHPVLDQMLPDTSKFRNFIGNISETTSSLQEMGKAGEKVLSPLLNQLKGTPLEGPVKKIIETLEGGLGKADFARQFENSFLSMATATGDFQKVIQSAGADLSGLDNKSDAFAQMFEKVGNRTGMASHEVAKYAREIGSIPGAIDDFNKENNLAISGLNYLEATMKVARGTGQTYSETIAQLNTIYDQLGTRGKPALEIISRISALSNLSGLPLSKMREFTITAAEAFKFLGDNSQGAIDIMANLGPALKSSGLGPAAINELVKGVTDGISQMGTAQKAFLSAQTGGPGGLQGAFSIDLMLKKGDLKGVYDKVQQNLMKQFGGKIVGLEEAARSPGAAAQYQRQLSVVQSGAFGGLAKTTPQAEALIDALSKGKGPEALKAPGESLKDALGTGTKLIDRQNISLLTTSNNFLERIAITNSIIAANSAKGAEKELLSKVKALDDFVKKSQEKTGKIAPLLGKGAAGGRSVDQIISETEEEIKKLLPKGKKTKTKEEPEIAEIKPTAPKTARQFATATFENVERTEKINPTQPLRTPETRIATAPTTINLICPECHKKVVMDHAKDATKKELSNYHQKGQVSEIQGPTPF